MIPPWPKLVFAAIAIVVPVAAPIWAIRRWTRISPKIRPPAWRAYFSVTAFALATLSGLTWIAMLPWAVINQSPGGDLVGFFWTGVVASATGFLTSILGNGILRGPACSLSAFMTILWLLVAFVPT